MRAIRLMVMIGLVAAGGYGVRLSWDSSAMHLRRVEVAGTERLSKEEVAEASGLAAGVHLLRVSTSEVSRRVESVPWVLVARVERIIPSRVRITVVERTPTAEVVLTGRVFAVDASGVLLEEEVEAPLRILDLPDAVAEPGQRLESRQFQEALKVAAALEGPIRDRLVLIRAPTVDRITLELREGTRVIFGAAERVAEKNLAVARVLEEAAREGREPASIDVRVPTRPAVRFRGG